MAAAPASVIWADGLFLSKVLLTPIYLHPACSQTLMIDSSEQCRVCAVNKHPHAACCPAAWPEPKPHLLVPVKKTCHLILTDIFDQPLSPIKCSGMDHVREAACVLCLLLV